MNIHKAYKFRLYPTKDQEVQMHQTMGCCRFVYNYFLDKYKNSCEENKQPFNYNASSAELTQLKKELSWLKQAESTALQSSLRSLDDAATRYLKGQNEFPTFRSKRTAKNSFTSKQVNGNIQVGERYIKLPKLGRIKFAKSREVEGRILSATIRKNHSGKYFVSILVETEVEPLPTNERHIGIDLGTTHFAITSEGKFYENPRYLRKAEKQLGRCQRALSRKYEEAKQQGRTLRDCKNYQKNKRRLAKLHERIANCRYDFLHKLTTKLIRENQTISMEDLQVSNLVKNQRLAKSIIDASWSLFRMMLEYKARWYGRSLNTVDPKYTSQTCYECGHISKENRPNQATFHCVNCGHTDHADVNAANNIKARAA